MASSAAAAAAAAAGAWTPLPLLWRKRDVGLELDERALAYLSQVQARKSVHVLGLCGPKATGKQLFLRTLLQASAREFPAPADDALQHEGRSVVLWLWRSAKTDSSEEPDTLRLVIASGASESAETPTPEDEERLQTAQHVLLLLLSSVLVYHSDGEINAQAIEKLQWVTRIASSIRIRANQDDAAVGNEFQNHAPKLVWVAENFKVKWLTSASGERLTPVEYLEQSLADEPGFSEPVVQRNALRMYMHMLFPARDMVTLSRPVEGTAAALPPATTERDALRAQYVQSIDKFYASFVSPKAARSNALPARTLLGNPLQGDQFAVVLQSYVNSLNEKGRPSMQLAAQMLQQRAVTEAFSSADHAYHSIMDTQSSEADAAAFVSKRDLFLEHLSGLQAARVKLNDLRARLPDQAQQTEFAKRLNAWEAGVAQTFEELNKQHEAQKRQHLQTALQEALVPLTMEQMGIDLASASRTSFADQLMHSLTQYQSELKQALVLYSATYSGPLADECLEDALLRSIMDNAIKAWGMVVLQQYRKHVGDLMSERTMLETRRQAVVEQDKALMRSGQKLKAGYEQQLKQTTQELSDLRRALRGDLERNKTEVEKLKSELTSMEMKHDLRIRNTESDIAWVRSRNAELIAQTEKERARLEQEENGEAQQQLLKERALHNEERSLMTKQQEVMTRVVELERALVEKKTQHTQRVFELENVMATTADEIRAEHADVVRQIKAQAKSDRSALESTHHKKVVAHRRDLDKLNRAIAEITIQIEAFDQEKTLKKSASTTSDSSPAKDSTAKDTAADADTDRTTERDPLATCSASMDMTTTSATIGPNPVTRAAAKSSGDMCKQS